MSAQSRKDLENQEIGGVEAGGGNVVQIFIALRDMAANQAAQLFYAHA